LERFQHHGILLSMNPRTHPLARPCSITALAAALLAGTAPAWAQEVFFTDFSAGLPSEVAPATAQLTGVQGYTGLGPAGNQFGGSFLRSPTGNVVTITLNNLPAHTALDIEFLFAAIDSLDGTGTYPQGDFLNCKLDGVSFFRESFANALESQTQSYVPPFSAQLARRVDLGFGGPGGYYTDSAYNFAMDPRFRGLAHTGSTAVLTFQMEGPGVQSLDDESWAMDNFRVSLRGVACGTSDFNGDGDFGTDADIEAFFACLAGNCCAACYPGGSDFNADGDFGTDQDIESFFRVLAGGPC
jgi:hypothetical protein